MLQPGANDWRNQPYQQPNQRVNTVLPMLHLGQYFDEKVQQTAANGGKGSIETVQGEMDSRKPDTKPSSYSPTVQKENTLY